MSYHRFLRYYAKSVFNSILALFACMIFEMFLQNWEQRIGLLLICFAVCFVMLMQAYLDEKLEALKQENTRSPKSKDCTASPGLRIADTPQCIPTPESQIRCQTEERV